MRILEAWTGRLIVAEQSATAKSPTTIAANATKLTAN